MAAEMTVAERKKLKVQEMRDELEARGLSTDGTKAVLLERLEEAIAQESLQDMPAEDGEDDDGGAAAEAETAQLNASSAADHDAAEENSSEVYERLRLVQAWYHIDWAHTALFPLLLSSGTPLRHDLQYS